VGTGEWAPKARAVGSSLGRRGGQGGKRIWSDEEVAVYKKALAEYGKDYDKIAELLGGAKTVAQVHSFWNNYKEKKYFLSKYVWSRTRTLHAIRSHPDSSLC
jgi:hypothetical protein